jgi:hypothetical protein
VLTGGSGFQVVFEGQLNGLFQAERRPALRVAGPRYKQADGKSGGQCFDPDTTASDSIQSLHENSGRAMF